MEYGIKLSDTMELFRLASRTTGFTGEIGSGLKALYKFNLWGVSLAHVLPDIKGGDTKGRRQLHTLRFAYTDSSWNTVDPVAVASHSGFFSPWTSQSQEILRVLTNGQLGSDRSNCSKQGCPWGKSVIQHLGRSQFFSKPPGDLDEV